MSRILFFAESINPEHSLEAQVNWELVQSLAECQHEIKVLTSFDEGEVPQLHQRVEVLRPFKKWNFFESAKLMPMVMAYNPDVLHFCQTSYSERWLRVFRYLASSLKIMQNPVVALSYFNIENDILGSPLKYHHLSYCDIILVPNSLQKQLVSVVPHLPEEQIVDVLTPSVTQSWSEPETTWIEEEFDNIVFVPGPLSSHERIQELFQAVAQQEALYRSVSEKEEAADNETVKPPTFVFVDGFGSLKTFEKRRLKNEIQNLGLHNRIFIFDSLNPAQRESLHRASEWVFLSSLSTAGFHVAYELRRSLKMKKPVVINSSQAVFDSFDWRDNENCLMAEKNQHSYWELLADKFINGKIREKISNQLFDLNAQSLLDAPGNRLSRLYLRARQ